jgi:hypothetical protein
MVITQKTGFQIPGITCQYRLYSKLDLINRYRISAVVKSSNSFLDSFRSVFFVIDQASILFKKSKVPSPNFYLFTEKLLPIKIMPG